MYRNILVPVDLSDKHSWRKALPTAISLCETFEARLHLITVVPEFGLPMVGQFFPEGYEAKLRQHAAKQLRDFAAEQVAAPRSNPAGSSPRARSTRRSSRPPTRSRPT